MKRILVAGIGNVFFGDDGFGVEVSTRLQQRALPDGVRVIDFGIRGLHLAYTLLEGYDAAILVDASRRGGAPGTLYVLDPGEATAAPSVEAHGMEPDKVLSLVRALGGTPPLLRVVACEPTAISEDDFEMGLSPAVAAAVDPACELVEQLVAELG
jgi:hydrogenase maturation protease